MGSKEKVEIDIETLEAFARILLAKRKIEKIEMESETFIKMLQKELKAFKKGMGNELEDWGKTTRNELSAWGDALKGFL